jgi:hypothetical protein
MPPRGGTAWTSDRIRPPPHKPSPHLAAQTPSKSDKGKGRSSTPEPPRSAAVRKLDDLLTGLRSYSSSPSRTPKNSAQDGCFCQGTRTPQPLSTSTSHPILSHITLGRIHPPSEYTPLCNTCGLILCTLQAPHHPCPHCTAPLLDASSRNALLVQLDEQRAYVLAEEASERQRAAEALRRAEGAFPALGGAAASSLPGGAPKGGGGVLSFDRQTKRVRVEAYRVREESERDGDGDRDGKETPLSSRVPPPISVREVQYLRVPRGLATRWAVSMGGESGAKYVAPPPP